MNYFRGVTLPILNPGCDPAIADMDEVLRACARCLAVRYCDCSPANIHSLFKTWSDTCGSLILSGY